MDHRTPGAVKGIARSAVRTCISMGELDRLTKEVARAPQKNERVVPGRYYEVELAGVKHFQASIRECVSGSVVRVVPDNANPFDESSLAVMFGGERLGYIPADSFVQPAMFDGGLAAFAKIKMVEPRADKLVHVIVELALLEPGDAEFLMIAYAMCEPSSVGLAAPPAVELKPRRRRRLWDKLFGRSQVG